MGPCMPVRQWAPMRRPPQTQRLRRRLLRPRLRRRRSRMRPWRHHPSWTTARCAASLPDLPLSPVAALDAAADVAIAVPLGSPQIDNGNAHAMVGYK